MRTGRLMHQEARPRALMSAVWAVGSVGYSWGWAGPAELSATTTEAALALPL